MSTENKIIDLVIDENVPFGMIMQFSDVDDITGAETPIDLSDYTLRGSISKTLEDGGAILTSFSTAIVDPDNGVASLALTPTQVALLSANASNIRDRYNPRVRFVGYYDLILTRTSLGADTSSTRIMEGKVQISDGVTQ